MTDKAATGSADISRADRQWWIKESKRFKRLSSVSISSKSRFRPMQKRQSRRESYDVIKMIFYVCFKKKFLLFGFGSAEDKFAREKNCRKWNLQDEPKILLQNCLCICMRCQSAHKTNWLVISQKKSLNSFRLFSPSSRVRPAPHEKVNFNNIIPREIFLFLLKCLSSQSLRCCPSDARSKMGEEEKDKQKL